jgi:hypothetical protein
MRANSPEVLIEFRRHDIAANPFRVFYSPPNSMKTSQIRSSGQRAADFFFLDPGRIAK